MSDPKPTQRLELDEKDIIVAPENQVDIEIETPEPGKARTVILLIESGLRKIELRNNVSYLLGRFSKSKPSVNHIDLSPFSAQDRGVSRVHAQLHMEDDYLYITDMGSTNGTYLDGIKLTPHQPVRIRQGASVMLARMHVQIVYKAYTVTSSAL